VRDFERKEMRKMGFHDREREINEIMNILNTEPTLITFIYGPINSGKTELINHITKQLPENYIVFNVNLRGKFVSDYRDFVRALFKIEREKTYKDIIRKISEVSVKALNFVGIPVTEDILNLLFKERTYEDVFEFLEDYFMKIGENKNSVLILDELQVIKDVKVDELLIYKLFNFFIRLTKELHLCHVFAITSDSLFVERIYKEAMLQGRCRYLFVDDFDYETAIAFLNKYKFREKEKEMVWEYVGGKPVYLVELANAKMNGKDIEEEVKKLLKIRTNQILSIFDEISLRKVEYSEEAIIEEFRRFENEEIIQYDRMNKEKIFLVERNILFIDPIQRTVKPQSKLDLLAIRNVLKCERKK